LNWRKWARAWNIAKAPIKVFHATDAANLHGEFRDWDRKRVADLVTKLLPIIANGSLLGVVVGIHMDSFREVLADRSDLRAMFGTPYTACFHWLVQIILNLQREAGSNEPIAFVHECNDYQREALEAFGQIKKWGNPQGSLISLQFGEKAKFAPLQAADILAYEGNKRFRDPNKDERRPWKALTLNDGVRAFHYGRENMDVLLSRLEKVQANQISQLSRGDGWSRAHGPWW
jgi:hypothetical protein